MILERLAESTRRRVERAKQQIPYEVIKKIALDICLNIDTLHTDIALPVTPSKRNSFAFEKALSVADISFICEVKKASPSKGVIAENFPYLSIAKDYTAAGAAAISVLTEPEFFMGSEKYLSEISKSVDIPVLRKDFTIDEYQIYEAKIIGADAVLLICALLDTDTISRYISICDGLGLSALVEAHTKEEIESAKQAGARIIGVNNRNLNTFEVDIHNSTELRTKVPKDILFVAESGIKTDGDVAALKKAGVNAVLIGETLMKCSNKKEMISYLKGQHE